MPATVPRTAAVPMLAILRVLRQSYAPSILTSPAKTRTTRPSASSNNAPSGPIPPDPGEFVGTARLTEILEHLRSHADIVLVDAPPLFHVGDGLVLSSKADAVLVVTRMDVMRRAMLGELSRLLHTMPAHKLGFILTGAEDEEGYGYGYGSYHYYRPHAHRERVEERA